MEVTRRSFADLADVGILVAQGVGDFEVIIAESPGPDPLVVYAVRNKKTTVLEAYTNSLAKAKYLCGEFDKDTKEGYDRLVSSQNPLAAIFGGGKDEPPTPQRLS
jgi:hypothetical protein